jgi:hypothetical protein
MSSLLFSTNKSDIQWSFNYRWGTRHIPEFALLLLLDLHFIQKVLRIESGSFTG